MTTSVPMEFSAGISTSVEEIVDKANLAWILLRWPEALNFYKSVENRASGHNVGHISYRLGLLYQKGKTQEDRDMAEKYLKKAFALVEKSAIEDGDCEALCDLGHMYENGNAVSANIQLGLRYYKQAADRNFPRGQYNLAVLLQDESATKGQALEYYKLAAKAEYPCAQYNLGCCLNREKDWKNAVRYFAKAADWGDADAQRQVANMFTSTNENIRGAAIDFLVDEWPKYHEKLDIECQETIVIFLLSMRRDSLILPELQVLVCKQIIRGWKNAHYQDKFSKDFIFKKLPPVKVLPRSS
jgi:TPR repeat protein